MEDAAARTAEVGGATSRVQSEIEERDEVTLASGSHSSFDSYDQPVLQQKKRLDSSTNSTTQQPTANSLPLTVDRRWKVEKEYAQRLSQMDEPSRAVPVAKWIFTIILGSAITTLFITTKISFVYLSLVLNTTEPASTPWSHDPKHTSQCMIIFLVLEVPYVVLFLRAAWVGLLTKQNPWPQTKAVLCCLLVGILEPVGIIVLALKVLPKLSLAVGLLILSSVVALSIFIETVRALRYHERSAVKIAMVVSSVCVLAGLCITAFLLCYQTKDSVYMTRDIIHAALGVVSLNIAWLPWILRHANKPSIHAQQSTGGNVNNSGLNSQGATDGGTQEAVGTEIESNFDKEATWKASTILYGVKIISTFFFCFIFFYVDSIFVQDNFDDKSRSAFIAAWDFPANNISTETWTAFGVNLIGALVCHVMAFIASHTNMQRGCLAIPFMLSLPLTIMFAAVHELCDTFIGTNEICRCDSAIWYYIVFATALITFGQTLSLGRYAFRKEKILLRDEEKLFWVPGYCGAIPDVWLLLDTRQTIKEGRVSRRANQQTGKPRVYICTTMYREDESEMQQLLESIAKINVAQAEGETFFESHIIFDGGVRRKNLSEFSLILISLLEDTLDVKPATCTKVLTPYGMKLSWGLPTKAGKMPMAFNIHLKDNTLVKNKKRWSQVMYMSFVLDFLQDTANPDEEMYILTTDADVMFTPESVEALLDLMVRDPTVGAVCARTHPMGSGPLVWYQKFEYAVGHWFQKASEHVLGSVLCAPGCFSVYRCRALRDILPMYCKKVESSFDFLTKDMGEDRWLCTLMVQSGWRIEYCAASENSTNCPSEFEEFYKQRRRWIASTLANLMLIIKEWKYIALFNQRVSVAFLLYQVLLLFSTLIAPSTVILVVAGGLVFAWDINVLVTILLQIIACILFAAACILAAPKTQIFLAKIYTFLYAVIMCAVAVGTAEQVVNDLYESEPKHSNVSSMSTHLPPSQHITEGIPVSITTVYFAFLLSVFCLAGLLHPREITCLFHGICFLLCIPSAYLVLMIYSICNLTDSSWGTREVETVSRSATKTSWTELYINVFYSIFFCLTRKSKPSRTVDAETQTENSVDRSVSILGLESLGADFGESSSSNEYQRQDSTQEHTEIAIEDVPISVDKWLPPDFKNKYAEIFKKHGYDNTLFIKGLTEKDLKRIGIKNRGHIQFLLAEISKLPAFEIEYKVPTDFKEWLEEIGLDQYSENFRRSRIRTAKEMEILKTFDRKDIEKQLGINKEGHMKRLIEAIRMLRDPSESQQKAVRMRQIIDETAVHSLRVLNVAEYEFWSRLKTKCLDPDLKAFGSDNEIKVKLVELRNDWLLVMAVANTLWLILITTLATKANLMLFGANPVGFVFLFIFGFLFAVQFMAMFVHRLYTLSHYVARAPYTYGRPFNTSWSFKHKADVSSASDYQRVHRVREEAVDAINRAAHQQKRPNLKVNEISDDERTPLIR